MTNDTISYKGYEIHVGSATVFADGGDIVCFLGRNAEECIEWVDQQIAMRPTYIRGAIA